MNIIKYKKKDGTVKLYNYDHPWVTGTERKYWLYLPFDKEWHKMPARVYESREYPICTQCKERFVPSENYKKCFRCRFTQK